MKSCLQCKHNQCYHLASSRKTWIEMQGSERQSLSGINSPITSIASSLSSCPLCFALSHSFIISPFLGQRHFKGSFRNREIHQSRQAGDPVWGGRRGGGRGAPRQHPAPAAGWIISIHTECAGLTSAGSRGCKQSRKPASLDVPLCWGLISLLHMNTHTLTGTLHWAKHWFISSAHTRLGAHIKKARRMESTSDSLCLEVNFVDEQ